MSSHVIDTSKFCRFCEVVISIKRICEIPDAWNCIKLLFWAKASFSTIISVNVGFNGLSIEFAGVVDWKVWFIFSYSNLVGIP